MNRGFGLASIALAGCATLTEVNGGPVVAVPTKEDASVGGALALHGALGSSNAGSNTMLGIDVNAKMKVTAQTQHIAFGDGFLDARPIGAGGEMLLRAGLHLVFERFDEKVLVGASSRIRGGTERS
jgi:hypothetical protein